jgi:N-acetylated-alpha-linked acidic dipeptidase
MCCFTIANTSFSSCAVFQVYGPVSSNAYGTSSFPGIKNSITLALSASSKHDDAAKMRQWAAVQHEIWRVARVVERAALVLQGSLT